MTRSIKSLWPSQIRSQVQSPFAILQGQAEALVEQTHGVLLGEVKRRESDNDEVTLSFDVVVPALDNYRHRIMSVTHRKELVYPVSMDADVFRASGLPVRSPWQKLEDHSNVLWGPKGEEKKPPNRADNDQELTALVAKVLESPYVVSAAQSLIARANDALREKERAAQQDPSQTANGDVSAKSAEPAPETGSPDLPDE